MNSKQLTAYYVKCTKPEKLHVVVLPATLVFPSRYNHATTNLALNDAETSQDKLSTGFAVYGVYQTT